MSAATALLAETTSSDWFARPWQSDDGLPNNTVAGLAQTADGYLWLGTPSGLARFDGIRFEDFSPTNFVAPPNRGTLAMLLGRDGALWLALDRGAVVRLDGHATRAFTEGLPSGNPNGLAEDAEGSLWIAYRLGAVCRIKGGQVSTMTEQDGLPAGIDICALTSDNKGRIWFANAPARRPPLCWKITTGRSGSGLRSMGCSGTTMRAFKASRPRMKRFGA